jgi:hypothetical protein
MYLNIISMRSDYFMSWETFKIEEIECPCGKGKIKQTIKSDDWNRIREEMPVIECEECSKKYNIISTYNTSKPKHEYTVYYCVNKHNPEEKIKLNL